MLMGRQGSWLENMRTSHFAVPNSKRRVIAALCLGAAVAASVFLRIHWAPVSADTDMLARIGRPIPALTVENSEGTADLSKLTTGTRSVIVFYSPACKTCERVLPSLRPFPDTLRLILVSESRDEGYEGLSEIPGAARFYDRQKSFSRMFTAPALPTILFIDESGILRDGIVGFYRREFVQQKLTNFAIHSGSRTRKSQWSERTDRHDPVHE